MDCGQGHTPRVPSVSGIVDESEGTPVVRMTWFAIVAVFGFGVCWGFFIAALMAAAKDYRDGWDRLPADFELVLYEDEDDR